MYPFRFAPGIVLVFLFVLLFGGVRSPPGVSGILFLFKENRADLLDRLGHVPYIREAVASAMDTVDDIQNILASVATPFQRLTEAGWRRLSDLREWLRYLDSFSDPKLRDWPLMASACQPLTIILIYFTIVHYGRAYMATAPPTANGPKSKGGGGGGGRGSAAVDLAHRPWFILLLFTYNISMSALNAWISFELLYCGLRRRYNFLCQLVHREADDDPHERRIAEAIWWYFASKGIELLDTVFIVLKRKRSQLTFLHLYHHSSMFAVWWVGAKFVPGGSTLTAALVNCLVHIVMYGYYAASSLGPRLRPWLWWKRYLTILQLIQFTMGVSLGLSSILTACPFTRWMQYVFVAYAFSFLVLFGNFYRQTYRLRSKRSTRTLESKKTLESNSLGANQGANQSALAPLFQGEFGRFFHTFTGKDSSSRSIPTSPTTSESESWSPGGGIPGGSSDGGGGMRDKISRQARGGGSRLQDHMTLKLKHKYGAQGQQHGGGGRRRRWAERKKTTTP